jgi:tetratricopeptide (TPR) repeat protein
MRRAVTIRLACGFALYALARSWAAQAAPNSSAFDAANKLYEEGKFGDAAAAYERLLQSGGVSEALYFNWGNAQFKAGHIGRAIAAYRQAEDLAPRDPDLRANLKFAREQVQGPTQRAGWRERLLGTLSLNEGSLLAAVLWLWLLLLAARQLKPALRQPLRNLTLTAALLTLLLGATLGLNLRARLSEQLAIVIANDVAVRNGPFEESPTAFTARDGAELRVLDRKDEWLQVSADARRVGWVARKNVLVMPGR